MRILPLLLLACTDSTDVPATPAPGSTANYSAALGDDPDFSDAHSAFRVSMAWDTVSFSGAFVDGPPLRLHAESEREGNCRVLTYTASTCDPGCVGGELCVDGTCQAFPSRVPEGSIVLETPEGPATIEPDGTGFYSHSAAISQTGPASLELSDQTLSVPNADPVEPIGDWGQAIGSRGNGDDVTLQWSNPVQGARVYAYFTDCTGSHGGLAPAEIECEGPDTGSLTLPGAFLDILDAGDWDRGECGAHVFERRHIAADPDDDTLRFTATGPTGLFYRPEL